MKTEHIRLKQAIPIGLIFSGVSAIGGLLIKGFNAISNCRGAMNKNKLVPLL